MSFQKGHAKFGGKTKGVSPIKATVAEICERLGSNPFDAMHALMTNQVPCGVCRGTGRTRYQMAKGHHEKGCDGRAIGLTDNCKCEGIGERTCQSCYGTLMESINPELRGKMAAELANYLQSKKKAIELSNPDGTLSPSAILRERYAARQ